MRLKKQKNNNFAWNEKENEQDFTKYTNQHPAT